MAAALVPQVAVTIIIHFTGWQECWADCGATLHRGLGLVDAVAGGHTAGLRVLTAPRRLQHGGVWTAEWTAVGQSWALIWSRNVL